MSTSKLAKHSSNLLFVCIAAFYLYGLGALPLVGSDEPRYAEVAREMLLRRDVITPTLGGIPWFEKPSLLYWMMMASYRVFGVNEYAARLGPALCGLITGGFIWWVGSAIESLNAPGSGEAERAAGWGTGRSSALAFLSTVGAIGFARAASFQQRRIKRPPRAPVRE